MPNRTRIAQDGTIIRETVDTDSAEPSLLHTNGEPQNDYRGSIDMSGTIATSQKWWQKPGSHWTVTMLVSIIISLFTFVFIAPLVFTTTGSSSFTESIINFFMMISPYVILVGGIIGQILYNVNVANKNNRGYKIKDYMLSPLISLGSVTVTGLAMTLLTLATVLLISLMVVALVLAVLMGIFSANR